MKTPIYSFLLEYEKRDATRLHMPGHKGKGPLGVEALDITEVKGADSLFEANGIISESERYAGELFGSNCFYSTEGSSLSIRAMVYLAMLYAKGRGRPARILAARNAHKSFISAIALTGCEVEWLWQRDLESYLSVGGVAEALREYLSSHGDEELPAALYITSPDYLGGCADIAALAELCHERDMLLLVDNAHGAYLKFLTPSLHPMDLGADMCCDSAHKTLEALTGAGYLHISKSAPRELRENARSAMSLFASTSPSYLILASLDLLNKTLEEGYGRKIDNLADNIAKCKRELSENGFKLVENEPMKITIATKSYGYLGTEFADELRKRNVECEFCDPDFVVLMFAPASSALVEDVKKSILDIKKRNEDAERLSALTPPSVSRPTVAMTPREATFSPAEEIDAARSEGRILSAPSVGCPPAVPIIASGEVITAEAVEAFLYYGIDFVKCVI